MKLTTTLFMFAVLSTGANLHAKKVNTPKVQEQKADNLLKRITLEDFNKGAFASFFNTSEQSKVKNEDGTTTLHYKTGGFKEYVDIFITVDPNNVIIASKLEIDRSWIQKSTVFAFDIEKSFIDEFSLDRKFTKPLVDQVWNFGKEKQEDLEDEDLQGLFDVVIGKKYDYKCTLKGQQVFQFENLKKEEGGFKLVTMIN